MKSFHSYHAKVPNFPDSFQFAQGSTSEPLPPVYIIHLAFSLVQEWKDGWFAWVEFCFGTNIARSSDF